MVRVGASCSSVPAQSNRKTKGAADPSSTGISGPSTATTALSIPQAASAAITCSTVPTRTFGAAGSDSTVQSRVSLTRS